jgi:peptidoglycan L-alanyl-D-glutamate endopeptidase CwlK
MIELAQRSISKSPIDFGIPGYGGLRTAEEQRELFNTGKSKCDGYSKKSRHQSGRAFDIYAYHNGNASWDKVHLAMIAGVILSEAKAMGLKVVWGGTFGSDNFHGWDMVHYELIE